MTQQYLFDRFSQQALQTLHRLPCCYVQSHLPPYVNCI